MAFENDTEQIERFALVPIGGIPDIDDRGQRRKVGLLRVAPQPHALVVARRKQLNHHCKSVRNVLGLGATCPVESAGAQIVDAARESAAGGLGGFPLVVAIAQKIDPAQIDHDVEFEPFGIAQRSTGVDPVPRGNFCYQLLAYLTQLGTLFGQRFL